MTRSDTVLSSILVDVELPDPVSLSPTLVDFLASVRIVLVGWYAVPEQTSPEQARDQFGEKATAALDSVARSFEEAGAEVTKRVVFTGNRLDSISRISTEEDCDAVLIPAETEQLRRILVPLRGLPNARRMASLVADLVQADTSAITLLHVVDGDRDASLSREHVLEPAAELMREHGVKADILRLETVQADDPGERIVEWAADADIVVLGESEPSVREILFGTVQQQIVEGVDVPGILVRHEREGEETAERAFHSE